MTETVEKNSWREEECRSISHGSRCAQCNSPADRLYHVVMVHSAGSECGTCQRSQPENDVGIEKKMILYEMNLHDISEFPTTVSYSILAYLSFQLIWNNIKNRLIKSKYCVQQTFTFDERENNVTDQTEVFCIKHKLWLFYKFEIL